MKLEIPLADGDASIGISISAPFAFVPAVKADGRTGNFVVMFCNGLYYNTVSPLAVRNL